MLQSALLAIFAFVLFYLIYKAFWKAPPIDSHNSEATKNTHYSGSDNPGSWSQYIEQDNYENG